MSPVHVPRRRVRPTPRVSRRYASCLAALALFLIMAALRPSNDNDFALPLCDPDGTFHESSDSPSPRTARSAKSREQLSLWWEAHAKLADAARSYSETSAGKTTPLVLLGDSITESWFGTNMGEPEGRAEGVPEVLDEILSEEKVGMTPLVLAIGGDQTQHLLWRMENGELLESVRDDPDAVFAVMIGTNNLGSGHLPGPTAEGVLAVAEYILTNTEGRLILLLLLPRGDTFKVERLCPPRCSSEGQPFKSFMPAITKVNEALKEATLYLKRMYGDQRFDYTDCGDAFEPIADGEEVNVDLMPDRLHPNAAGHRKLGKCLLSCVNGDCQQ
eukprot:CAMPEP_0183302430 /NCGR_PEP_ID=MMETSP0160_2-20130417/8213_1 /TAXON_ID=2839 ORGANISM="Odontella Sinensis, Strain Grunow 1884" /NCGR_SAMPLE_ID=MMETSP0160_2 /ASSEMBLY_ACC=CAM_ASM_000250 /LENGTH=329 /DNA_ID=CAMNT_0025465195 /DNA_START=158 /DNA_END=1147 /DNA_ORIENTATION=+